MTHIEKLSPECAHQIYRIAEIQSDDYHLDRPLFYACREDRERFCRDVTSGDGRVLECLMNHKFEGGMSEECQEKLTNRQRVRSLHYRADYALTSECKRDIIDNHCSSSDYVHATSLPSILVCLGQAKKLSPSCQFEIKSIRKQLLEDYRLTPEIQIHCEEPINKYCSDFMKQRGGSVLHCLLGVQRRFSSGIDPLISPECGSALHDLVKISDVVSDPRVDPVIRRSCGSLLSTRCSTEVIMEYDVYQCLLDNRDDPAMTDECRHHLFELEFFVTRDITLDRLMYQACKKDAEILCHYSVEKWQEHRQSNSMLVKCLWSHRYPPQYRNGKEIVRTLSAPCLKKVSDLMVVRASSVDLDPEVFQACLVDLGKFCLFNNQSNSRRDEEDSYWDEEEEEMHENGMACLGDNLDQLQPTCREAVVLYLRNVEEFPDLDNRIAQSCRAAEMRFCSNLEGSLQRVLHHDPGSVPDPEIAYHNLKFECLVEHKTDLTMEAECRAAIEHFQILSLKDVRIFKSFFDDCRSSLERHCPTVTHVAGSPSVSKVAAVMCLSRRLLEERLSAIAGKSTLGGIPSNCARHLQFELLARSESLALDPTLARACEADRKLFCVDVPEGFGEVISLIRGEDGLSIPRIGLMKHRLAVLQSRSIVLSTRNFLALECLREHRSRLSYLCREAIFSLDQLIMVNSQSDFKLMDACAGMIQSHCQGAALTSSPILLNCLKMAIMRAGDNFDPICQHVVQNRLAAQQLDSRLNPRLTKYCRHDIENKCKFELREDRNTPFETGNRVIRCLKAHYTASKTRNYREMRLTDSCSKYLRELLASINLDVRMDPLLVEVCHGDLVTYCSEELAFSDNFMSADGAALECLREQIALNKVKNDSCTLEVLRLTIASETDIDADPVLARNCIGALETVCTVTGRGGGRILDCLLDTLDSSEYSLDPLCKENLELRRKLQQMASRRLDWYFLIKEARQIYSPDLLVEIVLIAIGSILIICLCRARCIKRPIHVKDR
nr:golgi apparatus protein 1 [Hymenolepis microstoma]